MVAIIKSSGSLRNVLNYNEQKLKQNVAQLVHSRNFGKDTDQLGFTDKLKTIEKLTSLNQRTRLNAVHISLNFDPSEKPTKEILQKIADAYMQRIGFGNQPYLVYQHHDSGHPHIHIVSTNIQKDGSRIKMQNIGRNQSETARKEIEKEFRLVQAQASQLKQVYELKPVNAQKVQYGKMETKRAITVVLDTILRTYKYGSLPELNAVLRLYNIIADRGSENSRTYKNNGLVYRVLDEKGEKVGTPIKASDIYNNPGLKFLNEKFKLNEPLKLPFKRRVKNAIDLSFIKHKGQSLDEMITNLQKDKIQVVLRRNVQGVIYGMTYIDHQNKVVFNGSDLGKEYSANQIQERIREQMLQIQQQVIQSELAIKYKPIPNQTSEVVTNQPPAQKPDAEIKLSGLIEIMDVLTKPENEGYTPSDLKKKQKRKRKRLHH